MRRIFSSGIVFLLLSACAMTPTNYAILPSSAYLADVDVTWKRWEPTAGDISTAMSSVPSCLSVRQLDARDYHLQIAGVINGNGERELWINAFHNDRADGYPDWKEKTVIVTDGGTDYFDVMVNMDTKECHDLYVHGEA